ncbi:MAG: hypothetical protein JSW71_07750, partial [Gemmatimonadota bacterium]
MSTHLPAKPGVSLPEESAQPPSSTDSKWDQALGGSPLYDPRMDVRKYLAAVWRFKWVILLVTAVGTAAGVLGTRLIEPEYEAQATIWIETVQRREAQRGPIRSSGLFESSAWVDLLGSFVVLDHVVRDMWLYLRYGEPGDSAVLAGFQLNDEYVPGGYRLAVADEGGVFTLSTQDGRLLERGALGDSVGQDLGFGWLPLADELTPGRSIEFAVGNPRDAA